MAEDRSITVAALFLPCAVAPKGSPLRCDLGSVFCIKLSEGYFKIPAGRVAFCLLYFGFSYVKGLLQVVYAAVNIVAGALHKHLHPAVRRIADKTIQSITQGDT